MDTFVCTNCGADNKSHQKYCSRCGHELPKPVAQNVQEKLPSATTKTSGRGKQFLGILIGMAAFGLSYWGVHQLFFKPPSFDKVMVEVASEINKSCPMMIDQVTRLDNAIALPGNSIQYNYTLINIEAADISADSLKKYMEPGIINGIKTNPDLKIYRDKKTTMVYNYRDKNGVFLMRFSVTPEMYE